MIGLVGEFQPGLPLSMWGKADEMARLAAEALLIIGDAETPRSEIAPNDVGQMLLDVARCASYALEDSEETGEGHIITNEHAVDLQAALDALETLPPEPGYANSGPNNAAYALKRTVSATPPKWIPISQQPAIGQDVLAWCGWHITATFRHKNARKPTLCDWHTEDGVNPIFNVTHWMPLPEEPK